ncbi:MAG: hypothetical protein WAN14_24710 [Candidatus Acidiferrales bacterium]
MKYISALAGAVLLLALTAGAQTNFGNYVTLAAPSFMTASPSPATPTSSSATTFSSPSFPTASPSFAVASPAFALPTPVPPPQPPPQGVQGVFEKYSYDLSLGYTFFRFYEVPGIRSNMNGGNVSIVYWYRDWLGADGEVFAVYGSQPGQNSWQVFFGGGPRIRYVGPKGMDFWAHALIGGLFITPQTPYGSQSAVAGVVGAGVDLNGHARHMALRFGVDAVASNYFGTYQISPKASAGVVFKF